jgi:polyisoprenoid-binding protein YceI
MNQKALYGILIAVVVILLGLWALKAQRADAPSDVSTTTPATTTVTTTTNTTVTAPVSPASPAVGPSQGNLVDGAYTLSTEESLISWKGTKPLIKGYVDTGTLKLKSGSKVTVSEGNIASGEFFIDMDSLAVTTTSNTKVAAEKLESHLRSEDFLSIEAYPNAHFVVKSVTNGTVTGDLTIKNITKTITFPAKIVSESETRIVADASVILNRTNWDIRYGSGSFFEDLGDNLIDDKVGLTLHLVATK